MSMTLYFMLLTWAKAWNLLRSVMTVYKTSPIYNMLGLTSTALPKQSTGYWPHISLDAMDRNAEQAVTFCPRSILTAIITIFILFSKRFVLLKCNAYSSAKKLCPLYETRATFSLGSALPKHTWCRGYGFFKRKGMIKRKQHRQLPVWWFSTT